MRLPDGITHATRLDESTMRLVGVDGQRLVVSLGPDGRMWVDVIRPGEPTYRLVYEAPDRSTTNRRSTDSAATEPGTILAPTSGVLRECTVCEGDRIAADTVLAVVEAMKMRLEVRSKVAGTVTSVGAAVGDRIERGARLFTIADGPLPGPRPR